MIDEVTPALNKMLREMKPTRINKRLFKIAGQVKNDIHNRTISSKDYRESTFKPYNPAYAKYRTKRNKPARVTLSFTGAMLGSMTIKKIAKGAAIYFSDTAERLKGGYHHFGEGKMPKRAFFELSKKNINYAYKELGKPIIKAMK